MPKSENQNALDKFEQALARTDLTFVLRLYVAGATKKSSHSIERIRKICEKYLAGRYELEVIDIYQHPESAGEEQVIAAPTLVKSLPKPIRKLIGDMSDEDRILIGLGLKQLEVKKEDQTVAGKKKNAPGKK
ncbi:MAG: circadian clock KaiB family protein [Desulfobulbaceae bacterium]|nr:circadian clock KaiB family protein [Desulfobulbaceae bacterium]